MFGSTDELARRRIGTAAGIGAYTIWGVFPLAFDQLRSVEPGEVLLHRIVWSFVFVVGLLVWKGDRRWFDQVRRRPGGFARLILAGVLIAGNQPGPATASIVRVESPQPVRPPQVVGQPGAIDPD